MAESRHAAVLALLTPDERAAFDALEPAQQDAVLSWLYGESDLSGLTSDLVSLRTQAYLQRLVELGQRLGLSPGPLEAEVQQSIADAAAKSAISILQTHNGDLLRFVSGLRPDANVAQSVRDWERNRADWKSRQIAVTEAMASRNQADVTFRQRNHVSVRLRVVPETAAEPICAGYVDRGWMTPAEAADVELPPHPNCVHGWAYSGGLADELAGDSAPWLGSPVQRTEAA